MSTRIRHLGIAFVATAFSAAALYMSWIGSSTKPDAARREVVEASAPVAVEPQSASAVAAVAISAATIRGQEAPSAMSPEPAPKTSSTTGTQPSVPNERALMARLRELRQSSPEETLALARQGNSAYPKSPDAPERAWFAVRALVNMERFRDAQQEARKMVEMYPGTDWAYDVDRHLLAVPLDAE